MTMTSEKRVNDSKQPSHVPQHRGFAHGSGPCRLPTPQPGAQDMVSGSTAVAPCNVDDSDLDETTAPGYHVARKAATEPPVDHERRQALIDEILPLFDDVQLPTLQYIKRLLSGTHRENEPT